MLSEDEGAVQARSDSGNPVLAKSGQDMPGDRGKALQPLQTEYSKLYAENGNKNSKGVST